MLSASAAGIAAYPPTPLRGTDHASTGSLRRAMLDELHVGLPLEALAPHAGREPARAAGHPPQP